jgi:hypothetical protein
MPDAVKMLAHDVNRRIGQEMVDVGDAPVQRVLDRYHPELYHRVITYSGTFVNQQWPFNPAIPGGAWETTAGPGP